MIGSTLHAKEKMASTIVTRMHESPRRPENQRATKSSIEMLLKALSAAVGKAKKVALYNCRREGRKAPASKVVDYARRHARTFRRRALQQIRVGKQRDKGWFNADSWRACASRSHQPRGRL
jgi:hypothetical protein